MKTWSKTILSIYKYLETLSNSIDDLVLKKSINSAFYNNGRFNNCYDCANKIMQLTDRKINLINIKVMVDNTLSRMPLKYRQVLALAFIDNIKSEKIAELMGISLRTFFRRKNDAISSFAKNLSLQGYTSQKLESMFYGEHWIKNLYDKNLLMESGETKEEGFNKYRFFKSVLKEFNVV